MIFYLALWFMSNLFFASILFLPLMALALGFIQYGKIFHSNGIQCAAASVFFMLFAFLTFSSNGLVAAFHQDHVISEWVIAHPYSGIPLKTANDDLTAPSTILLDHLKDQWQHSDDCSLLEDAHPTWDVHGDFTEAETQFKNWFSDHDWHQESPPLPTVEFMVNYVYHKHGLTS